MENEPIRSLEEALAALEQNEGIALTPEARSAAMKLEVGDELDLRPYLPLNEKQEAVVIREMNGFSLRSGETD